MIAPFVYDGAMNGVVFLAYVKQVPAPTLAPGDVVVMDNLPARAERTIAAVWDTVGALVDLFTPTECANYFKTAGYEPD